MHIMVKNLNELKNRYLLWTVSELEKGKAFPQPSYGKRECPAQFDKSALLWTIFAQLLPETYFTSMFLYNIMPARKMHICTL
jgi:hypothetical protein